VSDKYDSADAALERDQVAEIARAEDERQPPAPFPAVLAVEGQEANGYVFAPGSLSWPDEPIPLLLGFDGDLIGKVEHLERVDDEIRGEVTLNQQGYDAAAVYDETPFEIDDEGIVGFGLAVHVSELEGEGEGLLTAGKITSVAATHEPAFRDARATRVVGGNEPVETPVEPGDLLRGHLERAVQESGRPAHPDVVAPVLEGRLDPTARSSENRLGETISAELRSVESALAYYTVEGLFIAMTPLAMLAVAHAMLQCLSGDHGELPEGVSAASLDPWGELAPFQVLLAPEHEEHDHDRLTCGEECRRALWHLEQAYQAAREQS